MPQTDIQDPPVQNGTLSDQDRSRLDSIVQKMVQNHESDDNIKTVVADFKGKYGKSQDQGYPAGTPNEKDLDFNQAQQDLPTAEESHQRQAFQAGQANAALINSPTADRTIINMSNYALRSRLQGEAAKQQQQGGGASSDATKIAQATMLPQILNQHLDPDNGYQAQMKQAVQSDPNAQRSLLHEIAIDNPGLANTIKTNTYLSDSRDRPENASKILDNASKIQNGDLSYDIKSGQLQKYMSPWEAMGAGFGERNRQMDMYNFYTTKSKDEIVNKLESDLNNHDVDEPTAVPHGKWGEAASFFGSESPNMAKGLVGSGLSTAAGAPELAPWVAALTTSPEFFERGYTNSLESNYHRLRSQGLKPYDALDQAQSMASKDAVADVVQGGLATAAGMKLGTSPTGVVSGEVSPGFVGAIKSIAPKLVHFGVEAGKEGVEQGTIGAGIQGIKNLNDGKPVTEGMGDAFATNAVLTGVIAGAAKGLLKGPEAYNAIRRGLSKLPPDVVNTATAHLVKDGSLTPEEANNFSSDIQKQGVANDVIGHLPEETQNRIQELAAHREYLSKSLETPGGETLKPEINAKIKAINARIDFLTNGKGDGENAVEAPDVNIPDKEFKPTADLPPSNQTEIQPTPAFRTMEMGDWEGKPETDELKTAQADAVTAGNEKMGGTGETFDQFRDRILPEFERITKEEPDNTTVVTHSSVLKGFKTWEEMGRPDPNNMTDEQKSEFAKRYNEEETHNGDVETFKGDNGDIHVVRHGQTQDNLEGNFRTPTTQLTDKGIAQAEESGQAIKDKIGDKKVPKIITSDLPRTVHTSNIIDNVLNNKQDGADVSANQGQASEPGNNPVSGEGQGNQENTGDAAAEQQAAKPTGAGSPPEVPKGESENKEHEPQNLVGISHDAQVDRAENSLNVDPPERGEGITLADAVQKGRDLIDKGTKPSDVVDAFNKDGKISADSMSVVRAEYERLAKETNDAYDKHGQDSPEGKAAFSAEREWYNKAVKPMQTEWHKVGMTQQGKVDVDTGSVSGMRRAFMNTSGKDFTPEQAAKAKELSDQVNGLTAKVADLQTQIDKLMKNGGGSSPKAGIKQRGQVLANAIRKAKLSRPDMFSSGTPASLAWDTGVEIVAKGVEAGSTIAQAIADGISHIKGTDWYKNLSSDNQKKAEDQFTQWSNDHANKKAPLDDYFADKTDNKFTPEEAKGVWDYAKEHYIDKGTTDFHDIVNGVAKDIGLTPDQVRHAIATPKGAKTITDQMYKAMYDRRRAVQNAEIWVKSAAQPKVIKFFKSLPDFFFAAKTFGHGTVGAVTHAGMNIFKPTSWNTYFPFFFQQFKNAFGSTAEYEKTMGDHVSDPDYIFWKRAGLSIDPNKTYDEYGNLGKYFGKLGLAGERGFNALKMYRLSQAKEIYSHLSNTEKQDPQTPQEIAKIVNHSTGTTEVKVPSGFNVAFFAPKLEISRWQRLVQQPIQAVKTFSNWNNATPSEKVAAKLIATRSGEMLATYTAALAANSAILGLAGSKQKINFTDPSQSDWMRFKAGDKTIDVSGGMLSTMRFISTLGAAAKQAWAGDGKGEKPQDKLYSKLGQQLRYKLSPFGSTAVDLITGVDAMGKPLPFSKVKPKAGEEPYSVLSYLGEAQTPIPIAEGIQAAAEGMKEKGMKQPDIMDIMNGIISGAVSGGTGTHLNPDYSLKPKAAGNGMH